MSPNSKSGGKLSVLMAVEDDFSCDRILEVLSKRRYDVHVARTCKEVVEFLWDHDCDVLIFDPEIKPIDGAEAIELIKKLRQDLPLVVFADDSSYESGVRIAQAGVFFRLVKPLDAEITSEVLRTLEEKRGK